MKERLAFTLPEDVEQAIIANIGTGAWIPDWTYSATVELLP